MTQGILRLLHVGCGRNTAANLPPPFNQPPWQETRLDIDPGAAPDILASITDMSPVADASMDGLWSAHNLEHLYPHEVELALSEFHRVLKPSGFTVITTPDLQMVARAIAEGRLMDTAYVAPAGPVAPIDMLYGFRPALARGQLYMAHRTGFTVASLGNALRQAGFSAIAVQPDDAWAVWAVASRNEADLQNVVRLAENLALRARPAVA